jgi:putative flippase GtrA
MAKPKALIAQAVSFGVVGVFVTLVNVSIYWVGAQLLHINPVLANTIGFIAAVIVGYVLQSKFVFSASEGTSAATSGMRYLGVALLGFAINSFWVWSMVSWLRLPIWTPIPLHLFATPVITFCLNRFWVFR